jgi:hypothetical protein
VGSLSESVIARIGLSRMLFRLAENAHKSTQSVALSACVNLLHDSIEAMLLAIAEHIDAQLERKTDFDKYFVVIDKRLLELDGETKRLPMKPQMLKLNALRIASKHQGLSPEKSEVDRGLFNCREFLEQCSDSILGGSFWLLDPVDIVEDGSSKGHLLRARSHFEKGEYVDCLRECRKVLFDEVESRYSVARFRDGTKYEGILGALMSDASYYKRDKDWIESNVRTPFDFIQLDHSKVDDMLMKEGFDPAIFWNIWRLTPAVFRFDDDSEWLVEYDPGIYAHPDMVDNARYVLESTIKFIVNRQMHRRGIRTRSATQIFLKLLHSGIPLYEKASRKSKVVGATPEGQTTIRAMIGSPALDGEGYFWNVFHVEDGKTTPFLSGYISDDDVADVSSTSGTQ